MDDLFSSYILELEFDKLMVMPKTKGQQLADDGNSEDEKEEDVVQSKSKLKLGYVYESSSPHETYYEIQMSENEKRLIDLTKMAELDDGEQPFIRINYEISAEENLEAIISNDEMVGYFEDFKAGKLRQKERLTNQSGIGVLQLIFP